MRHRSSRILFEYWDRLRGRRLAPERSEVEPGEIRGALGDSFILSLSGNEDPLFRLAGTRVCALFCCELKGSRFGDLWDDASRAEVHDLAVTAADDTVGVIAGVSAGMPDGRLDFELLLLPVFHRGRTDARLIGTLAPTSVPRCIGMEPLPALTVGPHRRIGPLVMPLREKSPPLPPGRMRRNFMVYEGGRTSPACAVHDR